MRVSVHRAVSRSVEILEVRIAPAFGGVIDLATLSSEDGFQLDAANPGDQAGYSVSAAGDVNGDGLADIIVGAPNASDSELGILGAAYLVFGSATPFPSNFGLGSVDGTTGVLLLGDASTGGASGPVAAAGDVNGDGFDDLLIGSSGAVGGDGTSNAGYIVFGHAAPFTPAIVLSELTGADGFAIAAPDSAAAAGYSVSGAGDLNGDGFADFVIGAPELNGTGKDDYSVGGAYVVFGRAGPFPATLPLTELDGTNGLRIRGEKAYDYAGTSVSGAGDVNGDGFADLIIGAPGSNYEGYDDSPRQASADGSRKHAYLIFGREVFGAELRVAELDGTNGFQINGEAHYDYFGAAVSGAGDVNGDGFDDIVIGAPAGLASDEVDKSFAYVVFGQRVFGANVSVTSLNGANGFRIAGVSAGDYLGSAVSSAGDINGDSFDDILVAGSYEGAASYVIFGKERNFPPNLSVASLNGEAGSRIAYESAGDEIDATIGRAGDFNGDGIDDFIVGVPSSVPGGSAYMIFGKPFDPDKPSQPNPQTMVYRDVDGDQVTIRVSNGTLDASNFVFIQSGDGFLLEKIDLRGQTEFEGASLSIIAVAQSSAAGVGSTDALATGPRLGDGKVNVGTIDATGLNLKKVKVGGGLARMSAGFGQPGKLAVKTMEVYSLGLAESTLLGAADAGLTMNGGIGKLKVLGNVLNFAASIGVGQNAGLKKMTVGGTMLGSEFAVGENFGALRVKGDMTDTSFTVGSNIQKVTVDQEMSGSSFVVGGALQSAIFKGGMKQSHFNAGEALGTVIVAGDVEASSLRAGSFVNNFVIGGSLVDSTLSAPGVLQPADASKAKAFSIIGIEGNVVRSQILAGYDQAGAAVNGDAGLGKIVITGNLEASSIVAGASAGGDGFFGTSDDGLVAGGNAVVARIASITVKGSVLGSAAPGDHFGIVSEELGSLKISGALIALAIGASNDLAGITIDTADEVRAREVG